MRNTIYKVSVKGFSVQGIGVQGHTVQGVGAHKNGVHKNRVFRSGVFRNGLCALTLVLLALTGNAIAGTAGLVANGLGGHGDYTAAFEEQADTVLAALRSLSPDDNDIQRFNGETAGADAFLAALREQAARADDVFILVLLGHGTVDRSTWRFNIAGPDITTEALVGALAEVKARRQVVVVSTSASGALLDVLAQPGRVVLTATKSAGEINAVQFSGSFANALASDAADVDRNEIVTVAEAFRFANSEVKAYYRDRQLLASEHARLAGDDADTVALAQLGALREARDNPAVVALLDDRLALEEQFRTLKRRKPEMTLSDYYQQLETLLLRIARLQQSIDSATGWSDSDA